MKMTPQCAKFYRHLLLNTATASMTATATGIPQKNICRYKRLLEKAGLVREQFIDYCMETGQRAAYLTAH